MNAYQSPSSRSMCRPRRNARSTAGNTGSLITASMLEKRELMLRLLPCARQCPVLDLELAGHGDPGPWPGGTRRGEPCHDRGDPARGGVSLALVEPGEHAARHGREALRRCRERFPYEGLEVDVVLLGGRRFELAFPRAARAGDRRTLPPHGGRPPQPDVPVRRGDERERPCGPRPNLLEQSLAERAVRIQPHDVPQVAMHVAVVLRPRLL